MASQQPLPLGVSEHSNVMGGSTAAQRRNCPGSFSLEAEMPKGPESEFAKRGSMLHACMELLITADPENIEAAEPLMQELIGQDMGFGDEFQVTQELVDTKLRPALAAWFEIVAEYGIDDWFIEQRVSLEAVVPGAFGTADILAKDTSNRLHSLDWKFGDGVPVPVEANDGGEPSSAEGLVGASISDSRRSAEGGERSDDEEAVPVRKDAAAAKTELRGEITPDGDVSMPSLADD